MKRSLALVLCGLAAFSALASRPHTAAAQSAQAQMSPVQQMFWQQIRAQDPYFNKSASALPQRYTPAAMPAARAAAPAPYTTVTQTQAQAQPQAAQVQATPSRPMGAADGPLWGYISELRFGVLSHDAKFPSRHGFDFPNPFANRYESGINLNPEVVFTSPDWLEWAWAPRPHVGVSVNTSGDTSSAYTGLNWDTAWDNGIFLDGFFGLAVHDGELRDGNPKGKVEFGSRALFRLGGELGWRWNDEQGIALLWEHMSNGGMFSSKNQGIDSLGLRYSYRFDSPY